MKRLKRQPRQASGLMGGWKLWRATTREYRAGFGQYFFLILIVAVPTLLLNLSSGFVSSGGFQAYTIVSSLLLDMALITLVKRRLAGRGVSVRDAYYYGTAAFIRFGLVSVTIILSLMPLALGLDLFSLGTSSATTTLAEVLLLALIGLVLALPSVWLFIRFGLAAIMVTDSDATPIATLRAARRLSIGKFWVMLGRFMVLVLWLFAVGIAFTGVAAVLGLVWHNLTGVLAVYQVLLSLTALPLGAIYLTLLTQKLQEQAAA